jgi:hypothetical protein
VSAACAQVFDATNLHEPASPERWLIHGGDDPAYALPDFDDSHWTSMDSRTDSPHQTLRGEKPNVVWYRLHITVSPADRQLALEEYYLARAFEIYVNGKPILSVGSVSPYVPRTMSAKLVRPIPAAEIASGNLVLAVRMYISKGDWSDPFPGLYYQNIVLGQEHELQQGILLSLMENDAPTWINRILGLGTVVLMLFFAEPNRKEYLWIFLLELTLTARAGWGIYDQTSDLPLPLEESAVIPIGLAMVVFTILLYFAFLGLKVQRWLWICVAIAFATQAAMWGSATNSAFLLTGLPMVVLLNGVIPVLLLFRWRKGNKEAGILLIPALLSSFGSYVFYAFRFLTWLMPEHFVTLDRWERRMFYHSIGPFSLTSDDIYGLLFTLSLTVIVVLRASKTSREQALLEGQLEAARGVQQVILPEIAEAVPGFLVETAYVPAQQVGGDFFQVLKTPDCGLLLVVGDVAGKGLPAAMLVSLLVGAIRGVAEFTTEPAELLSNLNERMVGRTHGSFATALVAKVGHDGQVSIANAGHLSPYWDGMEVQLPGALPLGLVSGSEYTTTNFHMAPGSRLTFYSDGVVEAANSKGEMFGFARAQACSSQSPDAIVEAAQQFGQNDDITVVTIEREALQAVAA